MAHELVPYLCEECWQPIITANAFPRRLINSVTKQVRWRYWHREHVPARMRRKPA